jgi:hypothetical protein
MFFYHFYIPVKSLTEPRSSSPRYRFQSIAELLRRDYTEVCVVCQGLLREQGCRVLDAALEAKGST